MAERRQPGYSGTFDRIYWRMARVLGFYKTPRHNLQRVEYFKTVGDTIGVIGVLHQRMVEEKAIPFAYPEDKLYRPHYLAEADKAEDFVLTPEIDRYATSASRSLLNAMNCLFALNGGRDSYPMISDETLAQFGEFSDPYFRQMLTDSWVQAKKSESPVLDFNLKFERLMEGAINNATRTTAHLSAIFGDEFSPVYPLMISRVALKNNGQALGMIGLHFPFEEPGFPNYDLLHPTDGLDQDKLKEMGFSWDLGCPASTPVSRETREVILAKTGVNLHRQNMLFNYAGDLHANMQATVRPVFDAMTDDERKNFYTVREIRLLSGEVWRSRQKNGQMIP